MENLNIEYIPIEKLHPYENNARKHEDFDIGTIKASINKFGFLDPIGIWGKKNTIVEGHGRYLACIELGIDEVPCIRLDNLSDDERKAYALAHNKTAENSSWDKNLLISELDDICDIDMTEFGFDIENLINVNIKDDNEDDGGYYGDARERTVNIVNLDDYDPNRVEGKYNMPVLYAELHMPDDIISFNYMLSSDQFEKGIHFYIDDYQFERVWNSPHEYIPKIARYDCSLTPDFSLYMEMPIAMQIWNVYRSRLIGQMMQDYGIKVIPTLSWTTRESYDFCFDGIEQGGTVSVSTVGVKRSDDAKFIWFDGMNEAMKRLKPKKILVYGGDIGYDFGDAEVKYIENHNSERFNSLKKKD